MDFCVLESGWTVFWIVLGPLKEGAGWRLAAFSWRHLGGSWVFLGDILEGLGHSWRRLGGILEALGAPLEASWRVLGALGSVLEAGQEASRCLQDNLKCQESETRSLQDASRSLRALYQSPHKTLQNLAQILPKARNISKFTGPLAHGVLDTS